MYKYTSESGWESITDFLRREGVDDCQEERKLAGYEAFPRFGVGNDDSSSFGVEVYAASFNTEDPPRYEYMVSIELGGVGEYVAVPSLPDLVDLLRQLVPIAANSGLWQIQNEKYEEEIENRIKQGWFARDRGKRS